MIIPFYGVWLLLITAVQSTVLKGIEILSVKPNLFFIFTLMTALLRGRKEGMVAGALFGLFLDISAGRLIGAYGILYLYMGFAVGVISERFISRAHFAFSLILTFIFTVLTEFVYFLLTLTVLNGADMGYSLLHIILPAAVYNTVAAAVMYFAVLKSLKFIGGVKIDEY